jgi:hypothetical protein
MAITSIKTGSSFTNLIKYDSFLAGNTAFNPSSFESIATVTGTGSAGSLTFSSIPSTYKHLQIRGIYKDTSTTAWAPLSVATLIRFNGVATASYISHWLYGNGSTVLASTNGTGDTYIYVRGTYMSSNATYANMTGTMILDIADYASTTKNKTVRYVAGNDANGNGTTNSISALGSGLFIDTTAISSITIYPADTAFATTSTFALYGIKGA